MTQPPDLVAPLGYELRISDQEPLETEAGELELFQDEGFRWYLYDETGPVIRSRRTWPTEAEARKNLQEHLVKGLP